MSLNIISWVRNIKPAPYAISSRLFLRMLGGIYFIAFVSLSTQIDGLVGSQGILPAGDYLSAVAQKLGAERYYHVPTLCWLSSSDAFLHFLCGGGALLALAAIAMPLHAHVWLVLWSFYLSLYSIGQDFLGFQWDILLLEAGFLAVFLAPLTLFPGRRKTFQPSRLAVWLLWWLLFRLMFASGVVKLTSGDPSWQLAETPEHLTALTYHYETQCIPPWTAWYMHHLPVWLHQASCAAMYLIEIVTSCFIFFPRHVRLIGCLLQVLLQVTIIATGNYGFFNYLTLALCVLLLDDDAWPSWCRGPAPTEPQARARPWPAWILAPIAAAIFFASVPVFVSGLSPKLRSELEWPWPFAQLASVAQQGNLVHAYGLFRSMTKERPEIVIEGSDDRKEWKPYEFKYKPGDIARRPAFVAPHQPRLDWQMWFAALGGTRQQHWFIALCLRLLEGSRPVLDLLDVNPFSDKPPRYVRAMLYDYHFTTFDERRQTGNWWKRELKGPFLRPVKLEDFKRP